MPSSMKLLAAACAAAFGSATAFAPAGAALRPASAVRAPVSALPGFCERGFKRKGAVCSKTDERMVAALCAAIGTAILHSAARADLAVADAFADGCVFAAHGRVLALPRGRASPYDPQELCCHSGTG